MRALNEAADIVLEQLAAGIAVTASPSVASPATASPAERGQRRR